MAFSDDDWEEYKKIECDRNRKDELMSNIKSRANERQVGKYVPKEDEFISKDGKTLVCRKCGGVRGVATYMPLFKMTRWTSEQCDCRKKASLEKGTAEQIAHDLETLRVNYSNKHFMESLGERYANVRFSDEWYQKPHEEDFMTAMSRLKAFVDNFDRVAQKGMGWYLWSPNRGNGKTSLSACVRNGLLDKNVSCIVIDPRKLNELKRFYPSEYERCKTVACLIVDDIGLQALSDWECDTFHEVINFRYLNVDEGNYVTCFTSNKEIKDLGASNVKVASIERLFEMSRTVMKLNGVSMRVH